MNQKFRRFVFLLLIVRCESESELDETCSTAACEREARNILARLDESIDPCEDIYLFACGNFINETEISNDKSFVSEFSILEVKLKYQVREALESPISADDEVPERNCKKLYSSCMNEDLIESIGLKPMKEIIKSMGGWPIVEETKWKKNVWSWQKVLWKLEAVNIGSDHIFEFSIEFDLKNSSKRKFYVDQPNLGIDQEYLLNGTEDKIVQAYYEFQVDTAVLFGANRSYAEVEAKKVLSFELELAKILPPKEERRNLTLKYNPMSIKEFQYIFPVHDWVNDIKLK